MNKSNQNQNILYGVRPIEHCLQTHPEIMVELFIAQQHQSHAIVELAQQMAVSFQIAKKSTLDRLSDDGVHQGFLAKIKPKNLFSQHDLLNEDQRPGVTELPSLNQSGVWLLLEGINDPHNLGACLRSAMGLGAKGVVLSRRNSASITPIVRKVASGAAETLPIVWGNGLNLIINHFKISGFSVLATALDESSTSLTRLTYPEKCLIMMGSEGQGLSKNICNLADQLISIEMKGLQSLNVSVATGIMLFEYARQYG